MVQLSCDRAINNSTLTFVMAATPINRRLNLFVELRCRSFRAVSPECEPNNTAPNWTKGREGAGVKMSIGAFLGQWARLSRQVKIRLAQSTPRRDDTRPQSFSSSMLDRVSALYIGPGFFKRCSFADTSAKCFASFDYLERFFHSRFFAVRSLAASFFLSRLS